MDEHFHSVRKGLGHDFPGFAYWIVSVFAFKRRKRRDVGLDRQQSCSIRLACLFAFLAKKGKGTGRMPPMVHYLIFLSEGTEKRGNCGMLLFILLIFCFFFSLRFFASCRRQSVLDCIGVRVCRMKPKTCSFFSKKPRKETKKN